MVMLAQQVVNGISIGCIYGLVALGYTMVFGVLRMVNFAHSEFFMLGPMTVFLALVSLSIIEVSQRATNVVMALSGPEQVLVIALMLGLAGILCALVGVLVERTTVRPLRLRGGGAVLTLVASLGAQTFLRNWAMLFLGRDKRGFPRIIPTLSLEVMGVSFTSFQLLMVVLSVAMMSALLYLVNKTYLGRCIRAVSQDRDMASLLGVDINRVITQVFLLGPALGGISGVLSSMYFEEVYYGMGATFGTRAWTAAVVGGIGSVSGAFIGGLLVGVLETIGAGYLPLVTRGALGAEYKDIFAFVLMILVLTVRPQGLLGSREKVK